MWIVVFNSLTDCTWQSSPSWGISSCWRRRFSSSCPGAHSCWLRLAVSQVTPRAHTHTHARLHTRCPTSLQKQGRLCKQTIVPCWYQHIFFFFFFLFKWNCVVGGCSVRTVCPTRWSLCCRCGRSALLRHHSGPLHLQQPVGRLPGQNQTGLTRTAAKELPFGCLSVGLQFDKPLWCKDQVKYFINVLRGQFELDQEVVVKAVMVKLQLCPLVGLIHGLFVLS